MPDNVQQTTFYATVKITVQHPTSVSVMEVPQLVGSEMDYNFTYDEDGVCIKDTRVTNVELSG